MKQHKWTFTLILVTLLLAFSFWGFQKYMNYNTNHIRTEENGILSTDQSLEVGQIIDSLNGIYVYYNGSTSNVEGRNIIDGYNVGLKYQCVEFIKRYYYLHLDHKMPDSYGHAKDFYNSSLSDGEMNPARNLIQYNNPSSTKPTENDILIYKPTAFNQYGHVAIISKVEENRIQIIQQNPGWNHGAREYYKLKQNADGNWVIDNGRIIGRLSTKK